VPGDVHLDLLKNGNIPDPFYRDNEVKLQWIEKAGGSTGPLSTQPRRLWLVKTSNWSLRAWIQLARFLNGQRLLHRTACFRMEIRRQSSAHEGANDLRIVFPAPMKASEAVARKTPGTPERTQIQKDTSAKRFMSLDGTGTTIRNKRCVPAAYLDVWTVRVSRHLCRTGRCDCCLRTSRCTRRSACFKRDQGER